MCWSPGGEAIGGGIVLLQAPLVELLILSVILILVGVIVPTPTLARLVVVACIFVGPAVLILRGVGRGDGLAPFYPIRIFVVCAPTSLVLFVVSPCTIIVVTPCIIVGSCVVRIIASIFTPTIITASCVVISV